jgi:ATP-dependent DNA ligase
MPYPIEPPIEPMLARLQPAIPRGDGWLYEPKWDGFRAIVFRDGDRVHIGSRNTQPLERYFPDVVETVRESTPPRCVLDGEVVVPGDGGLDFDALLQRIHPAESRVKMLARETPATLVVFDALAEDDEDLRGASFTERRARLVEAVDVGPRCMVTPQTEDPSTADQWFERFEGAGLDGIVAKRGELRYVPGERVMVKVKHERTADCVVGGYRLAKGGKGVGSLLLGLYDDGGVLHNVGFTSAFKAKERVELLERLRPLEGGDSFGHGRTPGGPSRWSQGRDMSWVPLRPDLVCEVAFDHMQGDRFRHGTRFLRWRPDKDPRSCTYDQLRPPQPFRFEEIARLAGRERRRSAPA